MQLWSALDQVVGWLGSLTYLGLASSRQSFAGTTGLCSICCLILHQASASLFTWQWQGPRVREEVYKVSGDWASELRTPSFYCILLAKVIKQANIQSGEIDATSWSCNHIAKGMLKGRKPSVGVVNAIIRTQPNMSEKFIGLDLH